MALRYLLDEHLRGDLWAALVRHNASGNDPIDVVRVGDPPDLPLSTADPEILDWADRNGRVLVTRDKRTMIGHLADRLASGHGSPGVFLIRDRSRLRDVVASLVYMAHAGDEPQWRDLLIRIP